MHGVFRYFLGVMLPRGAPERRGNPRYPFLSKLKGRRLSRGGFHDEREGVIQGQILNISAGGLCVRADRSLKESQLVHCQLRLPEPPIEIPTLMQVRWTAKPVGKQKFVVGLQFLL